MAVSLGATWGAEACEGAQGPKPEVAAAVDAERPVCGPPSFWAAQDGEDIQRHPDSHLCVIENVLSRESVPMDCRLVFLYIPIWQNKTLIVPSHLYRFFFFFIAKVSLVQKSILPLLVTQTLL